MKKIFRATLLLALFLSSYRADATNPATDTIYAPPTIVSLACDQYTWNISGELYSVLNRDTIIMDTLFRNDTLYTLQLTLKHTWVSKIAHESACDSAVWRGVHYYQTQQVSDTVHRSALTCDSIYKIKLTINPSNRGIEDYRHGCDVYTWGDNDYSVPGTYHHTFANRHGCDSVVTLFLSIDHGTSAVDTITACDSYLWMDGNTYFENNNSATWVIPNRKGCDSTITLDLTINHNSNLSEKDTVCDSMFWNGVRYTVSGDYLYHYTSQEGCPSVDSLFLVVNHSSTGVEYDTACDSFTWIDGVTYTESNHVAKYTFDNGNEARCDSVVTLNLVVNHSANVVESLVACDTLNWNGTLYNQDTVDTIVFQTIKGCDSTVVLNLTINHNSNLSEKDTVCDSMFWNGVRYTVSGDYLYHYTSQEGCPSVDTLHLVVNYSKSSLFSITECDSYSWNGKIYTESNHIDTCHVLTIHGCDSLITLDLSINHNTNTIVYDTACEEYNWVAGYPQTIVGTYNKSGIYFVNYNTAEGCLSVDSLFLTIHHDVTETRWNDVVTINNKTEFDRLDNCRWYHNGEYVGNKNYYREVGGLTGTYYVVAIDKNGDTIVSCPREFGNNPKSKSKAVAVPNPATDNTIIINGTWKDGDVVTIRDIHGLVVWSGVANDNGFAEINLNGLSRGIYMVKIGEDVIKVVKQ